MDPSIRAYLRSSPEGRVFLEEFEATKKQARRSRRQRQKDRPPRAPGKTKEDRIAKAYEFYKVERAKAFLRSEDPAGKPRCEEFTDGKRCCETGTDPDHALEGASRKECERLGAEGLIVRCRTHHDLKTANVPTRGYHLANMKEHAIRYGYKRLLALLDKAIAKYAGKRSVPVIVKESA
jgi:hypothetical protein